MYLMYMFQKKIKCENPFPNWKPITKISYIELDIIVSRLVDHSCAICTKKTPKTSCFMTPQNLNSQKWGEEKSEKRSPDT